MAKKMLNSFSRAFGLFQILRQANKILKIERLMHSIAFLVLLLTSILFLAKELLLKTMVPELVIDEQLSHTKPPSWHGESKSDIQILIAYTAITALASFGISFFAMVATIYASALACSEKQLPLKELLSNIRRIWKRPMSTRLFVLLLDIFFVGLELALINLFMKMNKGSVGGHVLIILLSLIVLFSSQYLSVLWMLGLVVSVLEEGFSGIRAFVKAKELIQGKKPQGFLLSLALAFITIRPGSLIRGLMTGFGVRKGPMEVAVGLLVENLNCLLDLYFFIVYTVYYCECKNRHGEKVEMNVDSGYSVVLTTAPPLVNDSLP